MGNIFFCIVLLFMISTTTFTFANDKIYESSEFFVLNNGVKMPTMLWGSGGSTQENSN